MLFLQSLTSKELDLLCKCAFNYAIHFEFNFLACNSFVLVPMEDLSQLGSSEEVWMGTRDVWSLSSRSIVTELLVFNSKIVSCRFQHFREAWSTLDLIQLSDKIQLEFACLPQLTPDLYNYSYSCKAKVMCVCTTVADTKSLVGPWVMYERRSYWVNLWRK